MQFALSYLLNRLSVYYIEEEAKPDKYVSFLNLP